MRKNALGDVAASGGGRLRQCGGRDERPVVHGRLRIGVPQAAAVELGERGGGREDEHWLPAAEAASARPTSCGASEREFFVGRLTQAGLRLIILTRPSPLSYSNSPAPHRRENVLVDTNPTLDNTTLLTSQ